MVTASITLSIIAVVVSFVLGALGAFPLSDGTTIGDALPGTDGSEKVQTAADGLLLGYTDIINDLASFQKDPDLARAEARKEAMFRYARELLGQYEGFSGTLSASLDDLPLRSHP